MSTARSAEYKRRFKLGKENELRAVMMTKVRIRQARAPWPHWHLLTFCGPDGGEARGVIDLIAIRKDHGSPRTGLRRGDALQLILIQVKGGHAARPSVTDTKRLQIVARHHHAREVLLATWEKRKAARFFSFRPRAAGAARWREVTDLPTIFG